MKRWFVVAVCLALACSLPAAAQKYHVKFDFDTAWQGDLAPGWINSAYRHGDAPIAKMYPTTGRNGSGGAMLVADSVPDYGASWIFWAAAMPGNINYDALKKEYDPWISAWYYDPGWESGNLHAAGQIYTVPSWVNPYLEGDEDWTDIQLGARTTKSDYYYYVAAGENSPGWQSTNVAREPGWVHFKMQLSSADGRVHFYINGVEVGQSYRNDYIDLAGADPGLYTMFTTPLSAWGEKPYTIWDDFEVGSNCVIPEPTSVLLGILGLSSIAGFRRLRRG